MARAMRHRGPDGFGLALDPGAGLVSTRLAIVDLPGGWQPLAGRAAGRSARLQRRGLQPPRAARRARRTRRGVRDHDRHRGRAAAARARRPRRARPLQRPVRVRLVAARAPAPDAGARPLRRAPAPLRAARRRDARLRLRGEGAVRLGEVRPAPDLAGSTTSSPLWGPRPPRTAFRGVHQLPPGGLVVWERGAVVPSGAGGRPPSARPTAAGEPAGAPARQRPPAPAGRRACGRLPLRRPRLEPDHRARPAGDERRAAHVLGRLRGPRYDERAHQERSRARSAPSTTSSRSARRRSRARCRTSSGTPRRRWCARRRCRCTCWRARSARAGHHRGRSRGRAPTSSSGATTSSRRSPLRELYRREPERARELLDELYPYLGEGARPARPGLRALPARDGQRRRPALLAPDPRRGHGPVRPSTGREVARRGRGRRARAACAPSCPRRLQRLGHPRARAWLELTTLLEPYLLAAQGDRVAMATASRGAIPSSTTGSSLSRRLPPERKLDGLARQGRAARARRGAAARRHRRAAQAALSRSGGGPFFAPHAPEWVDELLAPAALAETGIWDAERVDGLVRRCRCGPGSGDARGDGACRHTHDPALAPRVRQRGHGELRPRRPYRA